LALHDGAHLTFYEVGDVVGIHESDAWQIHTEARLHAHIAMIGGGTSSGGLA